MSLIGIIIFLIVIVYVFTTVKENRPKEIKESFNTLNNNNDTNNITSSSGKIVSQESLRVLIKKNISNFKISDQQRKRIFDDINLFLKNSYQDFTFKINSEKNFN